MAINATLALVSGRVVVRTVPDRVIDAQLVVGLQVLTSGATETSIASGVVVFAGDAVGQTVAVLHVEVVQTSLASVGAGRNHRAIGLVDQMTLAVVVEEALLAVLAKVLSGVEGQAVVLRVGLAVIIVEVETFCTFGAFIFVHIADLATRDGVLFTLAPIEVSALRTFDARGALEVPFPAVEFGGRVTVVVPAPKEEAWLTLQTFICVTAEFPTISLGVDNAVVKEQFAGASAGAGLLQEMTMRTFDTGVREFVGLSAVIQGVLDTFPIQVEVVVVLASHAEVQERVLVFAVGPVELLALALGPVVEVALEAIETTVLVGLVLGAELGGVLLAQALVVEHVFLLTGQALVLVDLGFSAIEHFAFETGASTAEEPIFTVATKHLVVLELGAVVDAGWATVTSGDVETFLALLAELVGAVVD